MPRAAVEHLAVDAAPEGERGIPERGRMQASQHRRRTADMVGVRMRQHEQRDRAATRAAARARPCDRPHPRPSSDGPRRPAASGRAACGTRRRLPARRRACAAPRRWTADAGRAARGSPHTRRRTRPAPRGRGARMRRPPPAPARPRPRRPPPRRWASRARRHPAPPRPPTRRRPAPPAAAGPRPRRAMRRPSSGATSTARKSVGCSTTRTGPATRFASGPTRLTCPKCHATSGAVTVVASVPTTSSRPSPRARADRGRGERARSTPRHALAASHGRPPARRDARWPGPAPVPHERRHAGDAELVAEIEDGARIDERERGRDGEDRPRRRRALQPSREGAQREHPAGADRGCGAPRRTMYAATASTDADDATLGDTRAIRSSSTSASATIATCRPETDSACTSPASANRSRRSGAMRRASAITSARTSRRPIAEAPIDVGADPRAQAGQQAALARRREQRVAEQHAAPLANGRPRARTTSPAIARPPRTATVMRRRQPPSSVVPCAARRGAASSSRTIVHAVRDATPTRQTASRRAASIAASAPATPTSASAAIRASRRSAAPSATIAPSAATTGPAPANAASSAVQSTR